MRASATSVLTSDTCNNVDSQASSSVQAVTQKMTRVQNAEEGVKYVTWLVHLLLHAIGAWPTNVGCSVLSKVRKWIQIILVYSIHFAVMVPSILYIFLNVKNTRNQIKLILPHYNSLCQVCKYTVVLRRNNEIRELLDDLRNDWLSGTEEDQNIYKTRATIGHRLVISIMIFLYCSGASVRALTPILRGKTVLPDNTTLRHLPCPGYFFFNDQISPNYEIIFFVQVLCGFVNYTTLSGTLALCTTLCLHMSSMLRILGNKMNELTNLSKMDEKTVQKKIADIVEYHTQFKE